MKNNKLIIIFLLIIFVLSSCQNDTKVSYKLLITSQKEIIGKKEVLITYLINETFLGNEQRNYYGNYAPSKLEIIWEHNLGTGKTRVGSSLKSWSGAGWTGQPLLVKENNVLYIIQGAYDHNLKKINAETGELVWNYKYDDVIKGTGTIWHNRNAEEDENEFVILQGSRKGVNNGLSAAVIPSYRAVSFFTGQDLWKYNSKRTECYSRDVDGSALILNDTAYLGLENGIFIVFDPDYKKAKQKDGLLQPLVYYTDSLYYPKDRNKHGGNLVTECSPSLLGDRIYLASGSGHVWGFNLKTKKIDWEFYTGSDIDGSPVVTSDGCLLISVEKQYIAGKGGVLKLDPSKESDSSVVWFFPVGNKNFAGWKGGIIGSVGINDSYIKDEKTPNLAAFIAIDGNTYVINHKELDGDKKVLGPNNIHYYSTPKQVMKYSTGPAISTPIIVGNKLIAATYDGIYLWQYDDNLNFTLLDQQIYGAFEATPVVHNGRLYVASRNGNLYCLGKK